jgi:hypothetical protein
MIMARTRLFPDLLIPCSREVSPLAYGVGVSPAQAPTCLPFRKLRQAKNSTAVSVATLSPIPDPRAVRSVLLLEALELPPGSARILLLGRRHADRSHAVPTFVVPHELLHQLRRVEAVRLRSAQPSVHLDAGRIDDEVLDPRFRQPPVDPEPVSPRLIAAEHASICWKFQLLFRRCHRAQHASDITSVDRGRSHLLPAGREGQLPQALAELEREVERRGLRRRSLHIEGRSDHEFLLAWSQEESRSGRPS